MSALWFPLMFDTMHYGFGLGRQHPMPSLIIQSYCPVADPEIYRGGFYLRMEKARIRKLINIHCYGIISDVIADTHVRTSTQK